MQYKFNTHHINHTYSKITISTKHKIEIVDIIFIVKQISDINARVNQYTFNSQTVFSARFDKQDEDDQVLHKVDLLIMLKNNQYSTQSGLDDINLRSQLERQI